MVSLNKNRNMINRRQITNSKRSSYAHCKRIEGDVPVLNNLALTPAQMYAMSLQGKPISANPLPEEFFVDGYPGEAESIPEIPLDERRGIDINDIWSAQKDFEKKVSKFRRHKKNSSSSSENVGNVDSNNLNI